MIVFALHCVNSAKGLVIYIYLAAYFHENFSRVFQNVSLLLNLLKAQLWIQEVLEKEEDNLKFLVVV